MLVQSSKPTSVPKTAASPDWRQGSLLASAKSPLALSETQFGGQVAWTPAQFQSMGPVPGAARLAFGQKKLFGQKKAVLSVPSPMPAASLRLLSFRLASAERE